MIIIIDLYLYLLSFAAPNVQAYLIGGLLALVGAAASVTYLYHVFKVDIVLWYRSTFHSAGTKEGKCG